MNTPLTPAQAWTLMADGNARFVAGTPAHPNQDVDHRATLVEGQTPHAVVFGCGDSRVAAEMIFDQGLGDVFVVRTAGHVFGPTVLGSLEFGAAALGAPLMIVLGHNSCGAVKASLETADDAAATPPGHIREITDALVPTVHAARAAGITAADDIGAEHVRRTVAQLVDSSPILAELVDAGRLAIVGCVYRLADGHVKIVSSMGELGQH